MRPAQHPQHQLESTHARGGVRSLIGRRRRRALAAAALLFALLAAVVPWVVFAATQTLNGGPGGAPCPLGTGWSTTTCWNSGAGPVPVTGDDVVIEFPAQRQTTYDLGAGVQLHSITLNSASGNVIISGGPIVLQSGGFITNNFGDTNEDFPRGHAEWAGDVHE